ncbi:hypothetical protein HDF09_004015 [Edaphobacter lichenicola]|uniref:Uncharacterized protein n=1 Tax=Tunturiibacter empetritectus TaxID=3069691 RepID=A0A7W8ILG4_9BACT|nr:hypothetical protein [Edaphobacter lichenicola]
MRYMITIHCSRCGPSHHFLAFDGIQLAGKCKLDKEWPIPTEILRARSDVTFFGHSHPFMPLRFLR